MRAHLDEARIQRLLHGQAKPAEIQTIREHLAVCPRCAQRVREWTPLFPEAADVLPPGERLPPPLPGTAPRVVVPDGYDAPAGRRIPVGRIAGALGLIALVVAAFLFRDQLPHPERQAEELPETIAPSAGTAVLPADTAELALGDTGVTSPVEAAPGTTATQPPPSRNPAPPAAQPRPQATTPAPATFPQPRSGTAASRPPASTPAAASPPPDTASTSRVPDPQTVQRVTLGDAIQALGGDVRLLQGITPDRVELVPSGQVRGAASGVPVVRITYSEPAGGTITLEEQRLPSRQGPAEPQVALDSIAGGNRATWVDRAGFRLSISVPGEQSMVLRMVNRVQ